MTNEERGRAIRFYVYGVEGVEVPAATGECPLCGGILSDLDGYADLVVGTMGNLDFSTFMVGSRFDDELIARERALWDDLGVDTGEEIKSEFNREVGKRVEALTGRTADIRLPDVTAIVDTRYDTVEIDIRPLFVYGRYRKLVRDIPQTRWPCRRCRGVGCDRCDGTGRMYSTSVEEIVCAPLVESAGGADHRFHGLGREDIDVRMLGSGRPFVAEVLEPRRRTLDLDAARGAINASGIVEVSPLVPVDRGMVRHVKDIRCDKEYEALIAVEAEATLLREAVRHLSGAVISQRTPTRVSRRRADIVRRRTVHGMELIGHEGDRVRVRVLAEAGTYIKELLHGDDGRTEPSLAGLLGTRVSVLELDVIEVRSDPLKDRNSP